MTFENKSILITESTGSLGKAVTDYINLNFNFHYEN
jgi:hypothetical protein